MAHTQGKSFDIIVETSYHIITSVLCNIKISLQCTYLIHSISEKAILSGKQVQLFYS